MASEEKIHSLLEEARKTFHFSGYQLFAQRKKRGLHLCGGKTAYWGPVKPVTATTYFDLGSLTKILLTTSVIARAVDRKEIDLSDRLAKFDSGLSKIGLGKLVIADLLSHASGLRGWMPIYQDLNKKDLKGWFQKHRKGIFESKPRQKSLYSDLGFLALGFVIDSVWGNCKKAFEQEVVIPLQLKRLQFAPLPKSASVCATEVCAYRNRLLVAEPFDENTHALGGVASHAGLFGTAEGIAPWCGAWLDAVAGESDWLSAKTARLFTTPTGRVAESTWGYGFDTRSRLFSSAGTLFSLKSFGWLGYPGCSIWMDPERGGFAIFLTNRIHPSRFDDRIRMLRPKVHDLIVGYWNE